MKEFSLFFFNNMKAFKKINIVITLDCNIRNATFKKKKKKKKKSHNAVDALRPWFKSLVISRAVCIWQSK